MRLMGALIAALSLVLLSGCMQHYWTRSHATLAEFASDHRECIEANSIPVVKRPGYAVVDEQAFRRCLVARGWTRREMSADNIPGGHYRSYEERDLEPVRISDLPEQPAAATIDPSDPRYYVQPRDPSLNRCQTVYADPRLRKQCAERDAGTR